MSSTLIERMLSNENGNQQLQHWLDTAEEIIVGNRPALQKALCCLLADGHLLIEDVPGVGKTTLAKTLARLVGLQYARVQFTNDLLPADLTGAAVYEQETGHFRFHRGPIFTEVLLADEINRASAKTQSALLEAMEEKQVSIDGQAHTLPLPFFVIATQNSHDQLGTHPLPESQLDRFLMRLSLGYPQREAERDVIAGPPRSEQLQSLAAVLTPQDLSALQKQAAAVNCKALVVDYVLDLLQASREAASDIGLSPRAGRALLSAARAWALIDGREFVIPEDVQAVFGSVASHRLAGGDATEGDRLATAILDTVTVP